MEGVTMGVAENIETARRFYAAGPAADDSERRGFFAADAVWHVPGANPVSGDYPGIEPITAEMGERMQPLERWDMSLRHIMGNADLVMAIVHLDASGRGHQVRTHAGHVFRFNAAGQIAEAWGFIEDQAAVDELFSASG